MVSHFFLWTDAPHYLIASRRASVVPMNLASRGFGLLRFWVEVKVGFKVLANFLLFFSTISVGFGHFR